MTQTVAELNEYFKYKCWRGLEERGLSEKEEYRKRLAYEIEVIEKMDFASYFLVVQDFINWAKRNDILVGPGRGSIVGSLAAYCLKITNGVDPLQHGLIFERFLNIDRVSYPDADIDFEQDKRELVINYVAQKYGAENISQIGTIGTMKAKQAIQKVCSALGYEISLGESLRKLCLLPIHGKPIPLEESVKRVKELAEFANSSKPEGKILRWATKFEGRTASVGVHASGVIIGDEPIFKIAPQFMAKNKRLATQWDMRTIEELGLIKFDFLGLATLDKMHICRDLIMERHGVKLDLDSLPDNDEATYKFLQRGYLLGIFQLEGSGGIRDLTIHVKPTCLGDLSAICAIFRPGPLQSSGLQDYLAWRSGAEPQYLIPQLTPILQETGGFVIYQEQVMKIAQQLAGYTMGEADILRKAMGKKKLDVLRAEKDKFKAGWLKNKLPLDKLEILWTQLLGFADYCFNASHSMAYGYLAYQTAYLKCHYPVEFMTACMIKDHDNPDQMLQYLGECKRMGIDVMPPDINESKEYFTIIDDKTVRFGLIPVRNIGEKPAAAIIQERFAHGPYKNIRDFCERVNLNKVNKLKLESLINAGALDSFKFNRATLVDWMEKYWAWRGEYEAYLSKMETFKKKTVAAATRLAEMAANPKLKPFKTPGAPEEPPVPEIIPREEFPEIQLLNNEHELLGLFISGHPLNCLELKEDTIENFKELSSGSYVRFAAIIISVKEHVIAKSKKKMAFLVLEDLSGRIEATLFPRMYEKFANLLTPLTPLLIEGQLEVAESEDGEERMTKLLIEEVAQIRLPSASKRTCFELTVTSQQLGKIQQLVRTDGKHKMFITVKLNSGSLMRIKTPINTSLEKKELQNFLDFVN
jgi:DNA polymerase-3 subunit alpha